MQNIIKRAKIFCCENKERLTKPRKEVLKIISETRKPLKAYEILEKLGKVIDKPKAPTVYRAIEFWQQNGFIHRIESLNSYVLCRANYRHKESQFMICDNCGLVIEAHTSQLPDMLKSLTDKNTFLPSIFNFEIQGLCKLCQVT